MRTSDKNVGRKFNIEKTSAPRQIALLMRNDYHRWAGAGVLIKRIQHLQEIFRLILRPAVASSGPEFITRIRELWLEKNNVGSIKCL